MNKPLTEGQRVRIIPREGTVVQVRMIQIRQHKAANWTPKSPRYTYDEIPAYLVEFPDGSKAELSQRDIEEI